MIGNRIKELRLKNGLTQKELAEKLNLTPKMVSFYELGERFPPHDILAKLADVFDVSSDYILGRNDDSTPPNAKEKSMPDLHGLDPENDRAYFSVMADLKKEGLSPHDLSVIAETYKAAKKRDREMK